VRLIPVVTPARWHGWKPGRNYLFCCGASKGENGNTTQEIAVSPLLDLFQFLLPIGVAFYLLRLRWTRVRDPEPGSATIQYEPPQKLTPAECGALLENAVETCGITATIVDLSVKGYLSIEQKDHGSAPGISKDSSDYFFHLLKLPNEWDKLKPHERATLTAIFIPTNALRMASDALSQIQKEAVSAGSPKLASAFARLEAKVKENPTLRALSEAGTDPQSLVALSDLQKDFHLHLPIICNAIFDALQAGGYYVSRPDRVRPLYVTAGILTGVVMVLVGVVLATKGGPWVSTVLNGAITGLVICVFGWFMPARSVTGARAVAKIRGFKNFLGRVEQDRIERLQSAPQLFEKYLPYAMALRVDTKWAEAFAGIAVPPPDWYKGKNGDSLPGKLARHLNLEPQMNTDQHR
jgi:hypothetical protein